MWKAKITAINDGLSITRLKNLPEVVNLFTAVLLEAIITIISLTGQNRHLSFRVSEVYTEIALHQVQISFQLWKLPALKNTVVEVVRAYCKPEQLQPLWVKLAYFYSVKFIKLHIQGGHCSSDSMFLSLLAVLPESIPGCSTYYSQESSYGLDLQGALCL